MGLLRFLLALSVIIYHFGRGFPNWFIFGGQAVQAFFIISGFYISLILNEKYSVTDLRSYFMFFSNRMARLLPFFWFMLIFEYIVRACYNGQFIQILPGAGLFGIDVWAMVVFLISHLTLIGQDLFLFLGIDATTGKFFFTGCYHCQPPVFT